MKFKKYILPAVILFSVLFTLCGAENSIAVAMPKAGAGISQDEVKAISAYIESRIGGNYSLYSRSSLDVMLQEDAFNKSGMVIDDGARAQMAQKSVKYLLSYSIAKAGTRFVMSMMVIDGATGAVKPGCRTSVDAGSIDALYMKIDSALDKMDMLDKAKASKVKTVAVLPVEVKGNAPKGAAESFHGKLSSYLVKTGSFAMVSRADLDKIAKESAVASMDLAASGQYAKRAELEVADYIIAAEISHFEAVPLGTATSIAGAPAPGRSKFSLMLQIRVLEVKTGRIIAQESLSDTMKTTDIDPQTRLNWTPADYTNAFFDRAASAAGAYLLERIDPLAVAAVDGGNVYLSRGEGSGIAPGQIYTVFNQGREIVHPVTGKVLGTAQSEAAEVKVVSVLPGMSIAVIVSGGDMIKTGALCRIKGGTPSGAAKLSGIGIPEKTVQDDAPAYPMAE